MGGTWRVQLNNTVFGGDVGCCCHCCSNLFEWAPTYSDEEALYAHK